ncbi:MAG TPA: phosphopyruvate hydratase [Candidatus Paceibacterota bacterium]|nr:phosphopyruvate hydratase [Candidatus Paceibacterota bacterium]
MRLDSLTARAIPDSRGKPTVEATLVSGERAASASVPSGKSTGAHEAKELRDPDGGVSTAIAHIGNEIAEALASRDFASAEEVDKLLIELDGTADKSRLGANAILAVSMAAARLFATERGTPLWKSIAERAGTSPSAPRLFVNLVNGGTHAGFRLPFQEHLLVIGGDLRGAYSVAKRAYEALGTRLGSVPMGDEGGYAPMFEKLDEPFVLLAELVKELPGTSLAIDAAANELRHGDGYQLLGRDYSSEELANVYRELAERFPLHSIEDPFGEDAHAEFAGLTTSFGSSPLVVGDDLTVTDPARIRSSAQAKEITAVVVKPNQIGTVSEAISAVSAARAAGLAPICSHRSGETMDTFIADFAYGTASHGIKAGGLGQKERLAKYERLVRIEEEARAS